jgi:hypothetical protein
VTDSRPANYSYLNLVRVIPLLKSLVFVALSIICSPSYGETETTATPTTTEVSTEAKNQGAMENLKSIQTAIDQKQNTISELKAQQKKVEDAAEKQAIELKIERLKTEISSLQQAFEHIALGGLDQSILTDKPEVKIDWREEIEQVSMPLLSTIKELTAKPREMDSLRRDIERREDQLQAINKAIESARFYKEQPLPPVAVDSINQLLNEWEQRRDDAKRSLEIATFKLASMSTETVPWYTSTGKAFNEFFRGRGLTLLLAITVSGIISLISKGILKLYWYWLARTRGDTGVRRAPLIYYSHRLVTAIIIVLALLMVFYIRGDVLLLTLAMVALVGAALALRQTLPRYAAELRLLLGVGPVRERERLVLDGVPFLVESLSVYTVLRNPALEGMVRLPLHTMDSLTSRPVGKEPWFPSQPGDHILLSDGSLGKIERQTIELVEIMVLDSLIQVRTQDFISQNNRNISRHGFGIVSTFGIDYQHQAICLDIVPARFREAIISRFKAAGMGDDLLDVMVEFSTAGASSLDYRIYLTLQSHASKAYFKSQRLVQQACVDTCNQEGWIIPFTQITVHTSPTEEAGGANSEKTTGSIAQSDSQASTSPD